MVYDTRAYWEFVLLLVRQHSHSWFRNLWSFFVLSKRFLFLMGSSLQLEERVVFLWLFWVEKWFAAWLYEPSFGTCQIKYNNTNHISTFGFVRENKPLAIRHTVPDGGTTWYSVWGGTPNIHPWRTGDVHSPEWEYRGVWRQTACMPTSAPTPVPVAYLTQSHRRPSGRQSNSGTSAVRQTGCWISGG